MARSPRFNGVCDQRNALGNAASLVCGTYVRFELKIDTDTRAIEAVRYMTNGCGFAIAAAETVAEKFERSNLTELHGSDSIASIITHSLGEVPAERVQCIEMVADAFRGALADHRKRTIEEFSGETALICTCFGITEDLLANLIESDNITGVDEVAAACNAGSGCGSCRMLIQEMIDSHKSLKELVVI